MAVEVGKAYIPVDGDFSKFDRDTKQAVGKAKSRFSGLAKVATAGLALGGGAVAVKVVKDSIQAASDINEALSKNRILFGQNAKIIEKFGETAVKNFGLSKLAAIDSAGAYGAFFKAAGKGTKEAAKQGTVLAGLSADLAAFFNTSAQEASDALKSGLAGESEPLRRYNIFLDDARLRQQAFKDGLIDTTKNALTPQQKTLAAYNLILAQSKDAQGNFALTSGDLAGQQKLLGAQWENMKGQLGKSLVPLILKATTALTRFITQFQAGKGAGGDFKNTLKDVAAALGAVIKFLGDHRTTLKVLIGLWVAYRLAAIAAIAKTRLALVGQFLGLKGRAAAAGALSGASYGRAFIRSAGPLIAAAIAADALINPATAGQPVGEERKSLKRGRDKLEESRRRAGLDPVTAKPLHPRRHRRPQLAAPHAPSGREFRSVVIENVNVSTPSSGAPDGRHLIRQLDLLAAASG